MRNRLLSTALTLFALIAGALTGLTLTAPAAQAAVGDGAPASAGELNPIPGSILFGMHMNPDATNAHLGLAAGTLTNQQVIENFETTQGRKMDLHRIFLKWDDEVPQTAKDSVARQRTPILSFAAYRKDSSVIRFADITAGAYDADIIRQAQQVQALGAAVYLTFNHEPDVYRQSGSAAEYVAAWQHYVNVYRSLGVSNVVWNWIMTPSSFGTQYVGAGAAAYYPGNDYVDILALDGYNWYGCSAGKPTAWRSMATIAGPFRTFGLGRGKPLMLAEWGSVEDPADPNRKANWIRETATTLASWPEFKAAAYFNTEGNCSWWLDSSPQATAAFAEVAAGAFTHGRANASLDVSTEHGSAPLPVTFRAGASAGAGSANGSGVATWSLDFGDGTPAATGEGAIPAELAHTYPAGVYTARLTLSDTLGHSAADTRVITSVGAPTLTGSESGLSDTGATLNVWSDPEGLPATLSIDWGTSPTYGATSTFPVEPVMYATQTSLPLAGLLPGAKYYWRASVTSEGGTTAMERSFTTAAAPVVENRPVSAITDTGAKLTTTITPFGLASTLTHQWRLPAAAELTGSNTISFAATTGTKYAVSYVEGLAPATTYEYRSIGVSDYGSATTDWVSFTTSAAPIVANQPVSSVTNSAAKLTTTIQPLGSASTLTHQWRLPAAAELTGSNTISFAATTGTKWAVSYVEGLAPATTYEYRSIGVSDYGSATTDWVSFTTAAAPVVEVKSVSSVTNSTAKLTSTISPLGAASSLTHQWRTAGSTSLAGSVTTAYAATTGTKWTIDTISGLQGCTVYEFRALGVSDYGTTATGWVGFTTACPPVVENKTVSSLRSTSLTLTSTISPQGPASTLRQEWRVADSSTLTGSTTYSYAATTGTKWAVTAVSGLTPNTTYEFRAIGTTVYGTTTTAWVRFTTLP